MRQTISAVLAAILLAMLCGCGAAEPAPVSTTAEATTTVADEQTEETTASDSETAATDRTTGGATPVSDPTAKTRPTVSRRSTATTTKATGKTTEKTEPDPTIATVAGSDWRTHPQDFKLIAFGFDDEPNYVVPGPNNTTEIIDTICKYNGTATLFVVGQSLEKNGTALLEYAVRHGFELGNHSDTHPYLAKLTYDQVKAEINKVNVLLKREMNYTPKYLRPPFLSVDSKVYAVCKQNGMYVINGNYNTTKKQWYTVEDDLQTAALSIKNAYDGAIYVYHAAKFMTADAMEEICSTLYAQGFRFCTVSELFAYKGIALTDLKQDGMINDAAGAKK